MRSKISKCSKLNCDLERKGLIEIPRFMYTFVLSLRERSIAAVFSRKSVSRKSSAEWLWLRLSERKPIRERKKDEERIVRLVRNLAKCDSAASTGSRKRKRALKGPALDLHLREEPEIESAVGRAQSFLSLSLSLFLPSALPLPPCAQVYFRPSCGMQILTAASSCPLCRSANRHPPGRWPPTGLFSGSWRGGLRFFPPFYFRQCLHERHATTTTTTLRVNRGRNYISRERPPPAGLMRKYHFHSEDGI